MLSQENEVELQLPSAFNAENISLADFFKSDGNSLMERVAPFSTYFHQSYEQGKALYSREIVGPCQHRTLVKDDQLGRVREMIMLGSNNYLGLSTHPRVCAAVHAAIDEYGIGMGGPPLLNGMTSLHRKLERKLANLKSGSAEPETVYDAMLFGSGFQANLGWVRGLMRKGDILLHDEFSHASLFDAITQMAGDPTSQIQAFRFRHNDVRHLERLLQRSTCNNNRLSRENKGQIFVSIEGVYSMDGDLARLPEIYDLCHQYGATLVVDDAHGTGVMGPKGGGTAEHFGLEGRIDISMGTFSKTFGATGGFIVARKEVIDFLRFFARSYMFSAHLPPTTVAGAIAALEVIAEEPSLLRDLHQNAAYLRGGLNHLGYHVQGDAAILPILIPESVDIRELSRRIHEEGVFLNSIEYPAVPKAEQRLRVSVMATHTRDDLDFVISVFKKMKREFHFERGLG